jgi:hypothetical protein
LIQMVMAHSCKNNTQALCMEVINSTLVFLVTSTIIKKPNTLLKVWVFLHRRWTPQEQCQKFTTKAQFLSFNQVRIQRVISEILLRKWILEDLIKAECRMTSNW